MATWKDIISQSLKQLSVVEGIGEAEQFNLDDGLAAAKLMLNDWALRNDWAPAAVRLEHAFAVSANSVSIGPAGQNADITAEPPVRLRTVRLVRDGQAWMLEASGLSRLETRADRLGRALGFDTPSWYYYERSHPVAELHFDAGTRSGDTLKISGYGHLTDGEFALDDEFDLPRGYDTAIAYNLVLYIASQYGKGAQVTPAVALIARNALSSIRRDSFADMTPSSDPAAVASQQGRHFGY